MSLEEALLAALSSVRWPEGDRIIEADENTLRTVVIPELTRALTTPGAYIPSASLPGPGVGGRSQP